MQSGPVYAYHCDNNVVLALASLRCSDYQCRLDIRKHSFSQRTINEWNKLSTDCVTASSVNMFKNKVDTYIRRAGYK